MMWRSAILLSFVLTGLPATAQQRSAQDKAWIAHCMAQISETNKPRAEKYCTCMAEAVDTSETMRQTDLERSFPPVHRDCFRQAGFRVPN